MNGRYCATNQDKYLFLNQKPPNNTLDYLGVFDLNSM